MFGRCDLYSRVTHSPVNTVVTCINKQLLILTLCLSETYTWLGKFFSFFYSVRRWHRWYSSAGPKEFNLRRRPFSRILKSGSRLEAREEANRFQSKQSFFHHIFFYDNKHLSRGDLTWAARVCFGSVDSKRRRQWEVTRVFVGAFRRVIQWKRRWTCVCFVSLNTFGVTCLKWSCKPHLCDRANEGQTATLFLVNCGPYWLRYCWALMLQ